MYVLYAKLRLPGKTLIRYTKKAFKHKNVKDYGLWYDVT